MDRKDNITGENSEEVVILLEDGTVLSVDDSACADDIYTEANETQEYGSETVTEPEETIIYETEPIDTAAVEAAQAEEASYVTEEALGDEIIYEESMYEEAPRLKDPNLDFEDEDIKDDDDSVIAGFFSGKGPIIAGIVLAVFILVAGVLIFLKQRPKEEKVDIASLGNNIAAIGVIGGDNIYNITSAQGVRLQEISDALKSYDYNEADAENGVTTVNLTLTTILKDLKIKFVNSKNKLIARVPFQVEVTYPNGKTVTWTDEDKDGIIYETELEGGSYSVKLVSLDGYDTKYDFTSSNPQSVAVKTQLDYKKVDVTNEIKKSNQVDEKEDKSSHDATLESSLKDTVAYVISAKVASGNGYEEIDKAAKILDPIKTIMQQTEVSLSRFKLLSAGPVNTTGDTGNGEGSGTGTGEGSGTGNEGGQGGESSQGGEGGQSGGSTPPTWGDWTSVDDTNHQRTDSEGHTETEAHTYGNWSAHDANQHVKTCTVCNHQVFENHNWTYAPIADKPGYHSKTCSVCGFSVAEEACERGADGKCTKCGRDLPATVTVSLAADKTTIYAGTSTDAEIPHIAQITPTVTASNGTTEYSITYASSDTNIATVDATGKITACKKGKGTAKITATVTLGTGEKGTATVDVTVKDVTLKLNYTTKKVVFVGGDTLPITATVTEQKKFNTVKWTSSDAAIATVSDAGVVTAVKEGTVTISAASVENPEVIEKLTVVVKIHPKNDKTTKLLDTAGNQVYVYDSSSKTYKAATYADYYSGAKLFTTAAVTYKYTGWWTIDGKTYYFDANGNKVTGDQVILGAKYSFGSDGALKSGSATLGIDVSTWNGNIDWNKVAKSGVSYAIIRCGFRGSTVGGLIEDNKYAANIKNATAAGVNVGVYFFTQALNEAEAIEEASMCLMLVEGYKLKYPIFIDVEASGGRADGISKAQRTANIKAFCKTIQNAGYTPGVYANKNWLTNYINTTELTGYTIWLAQYASAPTYTATRYDIWQYSSSGKIDGISGNVDLNLSYTGY